MKKQELNKYEELKKLIKEMNGFYSIESIYYAPGEHHSMLITYANTVLLMKLLHKIELLDRE